MSPADPGGAAHDHPQPDARRPSSCLRRRRRSAGGVRARLPSPRTPSQVVLEGGIIGVTFRDGSLPVSTNEMRAAFGAPMLTDINDVFLYAQSGFFDYGVLGAAQVDRFGNINSSIIGDHDHPTVRLPGSGGANDIASLCNRLLIVTSHESRRFVEMVDFITSPGWLSGGTARCDAGLLTRRSHRRGDRARRVRLPPGQQGDAPVARCSRASPSTTSVPGPGSM